LPANAIWFSSANSTTSIEWLQKTVEMRQEFGLPPSKTNSLNFQVFKSENKPPDSIPSTRTDPITIRQWVIELIKKVSAEDTK
jgi:hypothetical protein